MYNYIHSILRKSQIQELSTSTHTHMFHSIAPLATVPLVFLSIHDGLKGERLAS